MLRTAFRTLTALALLAATAAPAFAEDARATAAPVRAKSLIGTTVSLSGGTEAGTVQDIVFTNEGVVDYLIVAKGGKMVTVPWDAAKFNYEKRQATINLTEEQYRKIPTYTSERYPDYYAPTYRSEVYKYYNLRPGQQRRLERQERREERREERRP